MILAALSQSGNSCAQAKSRLVPLAVPGLVPYGAFAVAGTHDYLSLNRVRWQALNRLMQDGRTGT